MKSRSYAILAAVLVIVVFGSIFASCFWHSDSPEEGYSVTGVVTGLSSYNQPKLDVRADDVFEQGIALGSLFDIQAGGSVFEEGYCWTIIWARSCSTNSSTWSRTGTCP